MDAQSARGLAVWHLKRFLCCSAWRGLAQLQRERAHRFLLADVQAQGGHRDNNGLELHQANRLEAIASAINHVTGRSSFVPRRGGRVGACGDDGGGGSIGQCTLSLTKRFV